MVDWVTVEYVGTVNVCFAALSVPKVERERLGLPCWVTVDKACRFWGVVVGES